MKDEIFGGPFGNYPVGSIGAVLNSLCDDYNIPMRIVDSVTIGDGCVYYGSNLYGTFHWTKEGKMIFIKESVE